MLNTALFPRPFSYDSPRQLGYRPLISCKIIRVSRSKKTGWRATVYVDDCPMSFGHHGTKAAAEAHGARMIAAYAEVHYVQR